VLGRIVVQELEDVIVEVGDELVHCDRNAIGKALRVDG